MAHGFFAQVIVEARTARGLSQEEFAARCGVTQPNVARWESGTGPIMETTLGKVAAGLGVPIGVLLYRPALAAWRAHIADVKRRAARREARAGRERDRGTGRS